MRLHIDVKAERLGLGRLSLGGQWLDFYALLALSRTRSQDSGAFVTAELVSRVGSWQHKRLASVGKEIARHIMYIEKKGLAGLLECQGRTRAWRLSSPPDEQCFSPDRESVQAWVDDRTIHTIGGDGWIGELRALVETTVMVQRGETEAVLERLNQGPETTRATDPALDAWAALIRGTALVPYSDEDDEELYELKERWSRRVDAPGRAVGTRLRVLLARRHRFEAPADTLGSLAKVVANLEIRGDVSTLAIVLNVMGLLVRRTGDLRAAASHHLRAAALFGLSGDYPSLQAAVFNLAICRREALQQAGKPPDRALLDLVELCLLICDSFRVGNDSAQAEIAGAQWASEMGDVASARRYLQKAEELVRKLDATYDQAYFLQVRAEIELAHPSGATDPVHDLRTAESLFTKLGDTPAVAKIERMLRRAERRVRPPCVTVDVPPFSRSAHSSPVSASDSNVSSSGMSSSVGGSRGIPASSQRLSS